MGYLFAITCASCCDASIPVPTKHEKIAGATLEELNVCTRLAAFYLCRVGYEGLLIILFELT